MQIRLDVEEDFFCFSLTVVNRWRRVPISQQQTEYEPRATWRQSDSWRKQLFPVSLQQQAAVKRWIIVQHFAFDLEKWVGL